MWNLSRFDNKDTTTMFVMSFRDFGLLWAGFLHYFLVLLLLTLFIVNVIKCYLITYLCRTPSGRYIYGSFCKTLVCNCAND